VVFKTKVVLDVNGEKNIEKRLDGLKSNPADKIMYAGDSNEEVKILLVPLKL
jgi:hypothetical protein